MIILIFFLFTSSRHHLANYNTLILPKYCYKYCHIYRFFLIYYSKTHDKNTAETQ